MFTWWGCFAYFFYSLTKETFQSPPAKHHISFSLQVDGHSFVPENRTVALPRSVSILKKER